MNPPELARVSVLDALLTAMLCQHPIDAVASVDSALHLGLVRMSDLRPHCRDARRRRILDLVDSRAESGLESIVRVALVLAGLRVESQVVIAGVGRVDLVVEGRVVVETDGAAFHRGPRRHVDYVRDSATAVGGLTPLRFDAAQVLDDLPSVMQAVIAAVRESRGAPFSGREAEIALRRGERALRS
ncbi:MAG: DUF559 domain-containing protein [Actinomycetales bacterium]|nr:DUF559 domain-containing protein [Actinomycetales bacterium]